MNAKVLFLVICLASSILYVTRHLVIYEVLCVISWTIATHTHTHTHTKIKIKNNTTENFTRGVMARVKTKKNGTENLTRRLTARVITLKYVFWWTVCFCCHILADMLSNRYSFPLFFFFFSIIQLRREKRCLL